MQRVHEDIKLTPDPDRNWRFEITRRTWTSSK